MALQPITLNGQTGTGYVLDLRQSLDANNNPRTGAGAIVVTWVSGEFYVQPVFASWSGAALTMPATTAAYSGGNAFSSYSATVGTAPAIPTDPTPAAGAVARYAHLSTSALTKYSYGPEEQLTPLPPAQDVVYALVVYCKTAGELDIVLH